MNVDGKKKSQLRFHQTLKRSAFFIYKCRQQTTVTLAVPVTWSPIEIKDGFISHCSWCRCLKISFMYSSLLWNYSRPTRTLLILYVAIVHISFRKYFDSCIAVWLVFFIILCTLFYAFKNILRRTSLVAQWLRICLPTQGTRVRALVRKDPTCCGATKPVCHNYWACALQPTSHNYWSPCA